MTKIIEIVVSPTGETKLETKGFVGSECIEASRFVEEALGNAVVLEKTAAYFHKFSGHGSEIRIESS